VRCSFASCQTTKDCCPGLICNLSTEQCVRGG
jgi:hypothetical protein